MKYGRILLCFLGFIWQNVFALTLDEVKTNPSSLIGASTSEINRLSAGLDPKASAQLKRFASVRDRIEQCFKDRKDSRGIKEQLLSGALTDPCLSKAFGRDTLQQMAFDLSSIADAANFAAVRGMIQKRALTNAARSIVDYRTQFEGTLPVPTDAAGLTRLANEICKDCTESQKSFFKTQITAQAKAIPVDRPKYSMQSLTHLQNNTIEGLNQSLVKMEQAKNAEDEDAFNAAYEKYLVDYQRFTSTPAGALFLTEQMRETTGQLVTPSDASKKYWLAGQISFPKHKKLTDEKVCVPRGGCSTHSEHNIRKGLRQIESKVGEFTQKVLNSESFDDLLKVDPVLTGQMMMVNPALLGEMCRAAQSVMDSDKFKEGALEAADNVLNVIDGVSMVALVSGVGTAGGVIAKAVGAGLRGGLSLVKRQTANAARNMGSQRLLGVGPSMSTTFRHLATVGAVSEVGHIGSDGYRMLSLAGHSDMIVASRMAQATTEVDIKRLSEIEEQWGQSLSNLVQASALNTAAGVAPLAKGIMKIRTTPFFSKLFKDDLRSQLAGDGAYKDFVSSLSNRDLSVIGDLLKSGKIKEEDIAAAFAVASASKDGATNFKNGMKGNAAEFIQKLSQAGKEAASCTIN